jgi:hypothetical protein
VAEGAPEVSALQTIHPLPADALAAPACPHSRAAPGSPTAPPTIGQGKYGLSLHFLMWTAPTPCLPVTMPRRTGLDDPDGQAGSSFKDPAGAPIAYPASLPRGRLFPRQTHGRCVWLQRFASRCLLRLDFTFRSPGLLPRSIGPRSHLPPPPTSGSPCRRVPPAPPPARDECKATLFSNRRGIPALVQGSRCARFCQH